MMNHEDMPPDGEERTMDTRDNHEKQHRGSSSPVQEYNGNSDRRLSCRKSGGTELSPETTARHDQAGKPRTDQGESPGA